MDPELRREFDTLHAKLDGVHAEAQGARQTAEAAQQAAEGARQTAEAARQTAEGARQTAEAARQTAEAARQTADEARQTVEEARREARVLHEATLKAISTVAEGLIGLREHMDRRFDDFDRDLTNRHIGPLETGARWTVERLADHERRLAALESLANRR